MRKFNISVNGKNYQVEVEEVGQEQGFIPPVIQQVTEIKQEAKPVVGNGEKILAPMPGMIVALKVSDGAQVKKNDVIISLEAMKMENDIVATASGTIHFTCQKGSNVNTGDVLATIS